MWGKIENRRLVPPDIVYSFDTGRLMGVPNYTRVPAEVNHLNNQVLVRYFETEWRKVIC